MINFLDTISPVYKININKNNINMNKKQLI